MSPISYVAKYLDTVIKFMCVCMMTSQRGIVSAIVTSQRRTVSAIVTFQRGIVNAIVT